MHATDQIRRWRRVGLAGLLCLALPGLAMAAAPTTTPPKKPANASVQPSTHTAARALSQKSKCAHAKKGCKRVAGQVNKKRGQQGIDSARVREIQEALIRRHYLQGEPTGVWDSSTQAAMQRFQADQGWQSKTTPDSRALIKLGLGPRHDGLLNPESAITTTQTTKTTTTPTTAAAPAAGDPKAADSQSPPQDDPPKQ